MKATEQLKTEHAAVKTAMAILDEITSRIERGEEFDADHLEQLLEFIRVFTDRCHHGKEEDLLFPAMKAEAPGAVAPIGRMLEEHDRMRQHIGNFAEALARHRQGDASAAGALAENARAYLRQLAAHIDKEDNILFPLADRTLSEKQQEKLLADFETIEEERIGPGVHDRFHEMLHQLANRYLAEKAGVR